MTVTMTPPPSSTPPSRARARARSGCRLGMPARGWWWVGMLLLLGLVLWTRAQVAVVLVVGDSMVPTFRSGDVLLVHRGSYRNTTPLPGDIVVARYRSEWIVKRVVGVPGEAVEVLEGEVLVDGRPMPAPHPVNPGRLRVRPGVLAADRYALLGDNRAASEGILFYAVVPRDRMMGRVMGALHLGVMKAMVAR